MNDARVRDLEFRVKDLQGEIKALKRKLANIVYNAVDQIGKSFNLTVTERINTQPEFRREILKQVIECISSDDLLVAKKMLDQVIEADEGFDK